MSKDNKVTEEMEQLYGEIQVMFTTTNVISNSSYNETTKRENAVSAWMSTLPKIELPKFDRNLINWCFSGYVCIIGTNNRPISDIERFII